MSQSSKPIWASLISEQYPDLHPYQLDTLLVFAVSDWAVGKENDLTDAYEKYRMLAALTAETRSNDD